MSFWVFTEATNQSSLLSFNDRDAQMYTVQCDVNFILMSYCAAIGTKIVYCYCVR